eukprot:2762782-Prorocentrum_lima.AAC.1
MYNTRCCFLYWVALAIEKKKPETGGVDDRSRRYTTLWQKDFHRFAGVCWQLLTAESDNHAC